MMEHREAVLGAGKLMTLRQAEALQQGGDPVVQGLMDQQRATEGQLVSSSDGRRYEIRNVRHQGNTETLQVHRLDKVRGGKAAVKAAKRERQRARERARVLALVDFLSENIQPLPELK